MDELQQKIVDYVEANGKTYQQIALEIHEKPEVSNYEFFASKRLADQIKSRVRGGDAGGRSQNGICGEL